LSHLAGGGAQGELEAVVEYIKSKYQDFEGESGTALHLARMTSFANEMAKEFSMTPDQAEMVIAYVSSYLVIADEGKDALNEFNPSGSYQMLGVAKKVDELVAKGYALEQAIATVANNLGRSAEEVEKYYSMGKQGDDDDVLNEDSRVPQSSEEVAPYLQSLADAARRSFESLDEKGLERVQRIMNVVQNAMVSLPRNKNLNMNSAKIGELWSQAMRNPLGGSEPKLEAAALQESKNILAEQNGKLKSLLEDAGKELGRSNTTSAILLYENRVLSNDSLNERQKRRFTSAIAGAKSAAEAARLHEALVGAATDKREEREASMMVSQDVTLTEALERKSGSHLNMKGKVINEATLVDESVKTRLQQLTFPKE